MVRFGSLLSQVDPLDNQAGVVRGVNQSHATSEKVARASSKVRAAVDFDLSPTTSITCDLRSSTSLPLQARLVPSRKKTA